jgi:mitochondrial fission protein ELM1
MTRPSPQNADPPPLVWLLHGPKAGDNAQMDAVAAAAAERRPLTIRTRRLAFHAGELLVTLSRRPSLAGLDQGRSDALEPPWPDLVLTAGRRNEPVARWIRRASGGRTRIVHLGRPWAAPCSYDLVISTPQYFLEPSDPGPILVLDLPPVTAPKRSRPGEDDDADLVLLLGGDSGNQVLTADAAAAMVDQALALSRALGRGLRITTSPRTPAPAEARVIERLRDHPGVHLHAWHRDADHGNPYRDWLAAGSGFVVTADSVSMIAEAVATGRPVWIAPLPRPDRPWWQTRRGWRWKPLTHELAQKLAPRRFRRDRERLLQALTESGRAAWLAAGVEARFAERAPGADDAARAGEALLALLPDPVR